MSLKQLNGSYIAVDDRILFRFNTDDDSEYRLWLTRRITFFILAATPHLVEQKLAQSHAKPTAKAMAQFQQDVANEQTNLQAAYQVATKFPLGAQPVLATDVKCTLIPLPTGDVLAFDWTLPAGAQLNFKLALPMAQALRVLLERLAKQAHWLDGLPNLTAAPDSSTSPLAPPADPKQVH